MRKGEGFFIFCLFVAMWAMLVAVSFGAEIPKIGSPGFKEWFMAQPRISNYEPHRVAVGFKKESTVDQRNAVKERHNLKDSDYEASDMGSVHTELLVIEDDRDPNDVARTLMSSEDIVLFAEPNGFLSNKDPETDEPQKEMEPDGPHVPSTQSFSTDPANTYLWNYSRIEVFPAWDLVPPASTVKTKVCIVDEGMPFSHAQIDSSRTILGCNYVIPGECTPPLSGSNHGLGIAGIIAAKWNDGVSIGGIMKNDVILVIEKVCNDNSTCPQEAVEKGIKDCIANGARIINLSLAAEGYSSLIANALTYAVGEKGAIVFCAAGNGGQYNVVNPVYPAILEECTTISGTDKNDNKWTLSAWGNHIFAAAPAVEIYSIRNENATALELYNGTSFSVPHAVSVAGLRLNQCPTSTANQLKSALKAGAIDLGSDVQFGHGLIDAKRTLALPCPVNHRAGWNPDWNRGGIGGGPRTCRPGSVC